MGDWADDQDQDDVSPVAPHPTLSGWRFKVILVAGFAILALVALGPYFQIVQTRQASRQLTAIHAQGDEILSIQKDTQKAVADLEQIISFIASVQNGPQAKASRDATTWYIQQFQAICKATPDCKQIPLPPSLQKAIHPTG